MDLEVLQKLNAVPSVNYTSSQFITGLFCYEMKIGEIQAYFSECDFQSGEDLREKGLVDFYLVKGQKRAFVKISKEALLHTDLVKESIEERFNNQ